MMIQQRKLRKWKVPKKTKVNAKLSRLSIFSPDIEGRKIKTGVPFWRDFREESSLKVLIQNKKRLSKRLKKKMFRMSILQRRNNLNKKWKIFPILDCFQSNTKEEKLTLAIPHSDKRDNKIKNRFTHQPLKHYLLYLFNSRKKQ